MFAAAKSYRELKYNRLMEELRNLHQNAYDYIVNVRPEKWSHVHCPQGRYRLITTNTIKCLNSCLRFARKLPMLILAEFVRDMLQRWYYDCYQAIESMHHQSIDAAKLKISKHIGKRKHISVTHVDRNIFLEKLKGDQWTVNLLRKTCKCKKFQLDYLPCSHALAAARKSFVSIVCDVSKCMACIGETWTLDAAGTVLGVAGTVLYYSDARDLDPVGVPMSTTLNSLTFSADSDISPSPLSIVAASSRSETRLPTSSISWYYHLPLSASVAISSASAYI
ncbi:hypothetical protein Dsin_025180 [Dipteronia sinensis]|uniref:SWIM-type domain-containing protein n=1 Tax=Dipteronia sinensis TaxID=43782 RepID=A0AAD9ZVM0_9ROSI|nr:hypothetical protein Dsin_025180 [Dipteronia sinensis]